MTSSTSIVARCVLAFFFPLALLCPLYSGMQSRPATAQSAEPSQELKGLEEAASKFYKEDAFAEALQVAEKALALTEREFGPNHERTAIQTYSVGMVAEAAGRLAESERAYSQSVSIRNKVYGANSAGSAQAMEKLGQVLLRRGKTDEAEVLMQRVLKIRSDLVGSQHSFTAGARADLGALNIARGNYSDALTYYREAVRLLTSQQAAQTLARSVVDDEIRRHRPVFAGLALAGWEAGGDRQAMMEESFAASQQAWSTSAAGAIARMSARLGAGNTDLGGRIRRLQDMSERVLALHDEDMKALGARNTQQRADPAYSAAVDAFRAASISQARDNAPITIRQKALVEQLQTQIKRCPPGQKVAGCDNSDREREAITRELTALAAEAAQGSGNLMALNQRLLAADQQVAGYADFTSRRTARLDEGQRLELAISQERAAIVRLFPDYVALTEPKPLSIAQTQSLLQPHEALVTLLVGPAKSFVWAISRQRAEWSMIDAGADVLLQYVTQLRRGLDQSSADQPDAAGQITSGFDLERAHALYRLVLAPVAAVLEGKQHVIVVPTGPLSSLPFQVLVTETPRTIGDEVERMRAASWLIKRHALSVLPSVQSLAALRGLSPSGAPMKPFLGIGDPLLTGPPADPQRRGRGGRSEMSNPRSAYRNGQVNLRAVREMVPLPETADELRAVAKVLGAEPDSIFLQESASETRIKQLRLEDYRVIHFATHGLVAGELSGSEEPALVLTPPQTPSDVDDGLLTASEVASLRISADWVVLSACNTAAGSDTGAEALSGLARAFFYAGARGLLVSHWAVDSDAAVEITTHTFSTLAADPKLGRAEAFRRTMVQMIDVGRPPTYWAPFVILGEGSYSR